MIYNHTGCICLTFLQCAFSNVSSNYLREKMHNHTGCICLTFLHCAFSNVSSNDLCEKMHNHTGCICLIFPCVQWQLFHWNSSPGNYHDLGFVPSPQGGKVYHFGFCLLGSFPTTSWVTGATLCWSECKYKKISIIAKRAPVGANKNCYKNVCHEFAGKLANSLIDNAAALPCISNGPYII